MKIRSIEDLAAAKARGLATLYPGKAKISVGMASCGVASGSGAVMKALQEETKKSGLDAFIFPVGCIGSCHREPLVDIALPGKPRVTYANVTSEMAADIARSIVSGEVRKDWLYIRTEEDENPVDGARTRIRDAAASSAGGSGTPSNRASGGSSYYHALDFSDVPLFESIPFFKKQKRIVLRNCGVINPDSIDEYIARGGYFTLFKVLNELKPEQVIQEVKTSGLRGRGGAGFPTGLKWQFTRQAEGDAKYIICNADEGDPGAYMDRSVLEGDPHSVLEGMTIGAFAVGAHEGYIYVRAEYPLAIQKLNQAIRQAEEYGFLGDNILGTGFSFRVKLSKGAGAFVCGEETALMASIEGRVGEPRPRPPFPAQSGLWGKPTNINNVETWANVPVILSRGGAWYAGLGTEKSKGTKVFSLVGKIAQSGLIEVPMGITLREIIYDIGGGIPDGRQFKAVQTGGPSGGCLPESLLDLPVDYERLTQAGAIMGSGGMVIMDDKVCMVDIARYFLTFTATESCGKCAPCRIGTHVMNEVLGRICEGQGREGDIEYLESLAGTVHELSLCGLGQTAPNPVLTTLKYFRHEYETHIRDKKCPAGVCKRKFTPEEIARMKEEAARKRAALKQAGGAEQDTRAKPATAAKPKPTGKSDVPGNSKKPTR
jgi:NADH:ubiquinone oxidoreductase subunit F (NADH-binding)/(2Fe-2S) ferredoxin